MISENYWECSNTSELFYKLIGERFGPSPELHETTIRSEKELEAERILSRLEARPEHLGLEIGSGCGYLTKIAAKNTAHVTAVDISNSYLTFAKFHCSEIKNIEFRKIANEDLSFLSDDSLDYCYSHSVFIHLNFFQIVRYLRQVHRILKDGGKFWFDIVEIERVEISDPIFQNSLKASGSNPRHGGYLYFNSSSAIENAAISLNFLVEKIHRGENCNTSFLLKK